MRGIDLHTHSNCSDGTYSVKELMDYAHAKNLAAIALTDHDTVDGLDEASSYVKENYPDMELVPGIEFSTEHNGQELHILGLFVQPSFYQEVTEYVKTADKLKEASNIELAQKLNENGYLIDYNKIKSATPNGRVNRAHFAAALCESGYVKSRSEAFATILSEEYGWYKRPESLSSLETIEFIRSIGAVPVWAHPLFHVNCKECEAFLPVAKEHGLIGIETEYSTYSEDDTAFSKRMCEKFNVLESGGSDYHGKNKPDISIGKGKGNLAISYNYFVELRKAAGK